MRVSFNGSAKLVNGEGRAGLTSGLGGYLEQVEWVVMNCRKREREREIV